MKTVRMRTFVVVLLGFCWAFASVGCQWISGLDDLRVGSKKEEESVTSGSGGAGGFGGGTAAGGGGITGEDCSLFDLPNQAPVYCSEDTGGMANITFQNHCNQGELLEVLWIPRFDNMTGTCGMLQSYSTFEPGTTVQLTSGIGHRFRIQESGTQRVLKDDIVINQDEQVITVP